jgi:hypothetical protein
LSDFQTILHHFRLKTIKIVDFLLANSHSTWKMRGFLSQKFRKLQALGRQDKSTVFTPKFNHHSDRNSEQSLANFAPPINFWSLLTWNASDFSDGTLAKFENFFDVQLDERRKGFYIFG